MAKKVSKKKRARTGAPQRGKRSALRSGSKGAQNIAFATAMLQKNREATTREILETGRKNGLKVTTNQISAVRKKLKISSGRGRRPGSGTRKVPARRRAVRMWTSNVDTHLQDAVIEAIKSGQYGVARNILSVLEKS